MNKSSTYKNTWKPAVQDKTQSDTKSGSSIKSALITVALITFVVLLILVQLRVVKGPVAFAVIVIYLGLLIADCVMTCFTSPEKSAEAKPD